MKTLLKQITAGALLTALALPAFARDIPQTISKVDASMYGSSSFWCNGREFVSDIQLPNFHGCDASSVNFASVGMEASLLTVYYDWEEMSDASMTPKTALFIERPNGDVYRILDRSFLTSAKLQMYFERGAGFGVNSPRVQSNLMLSRFSHRVIQSYGETLCSEFHMKYPFVGVQGWCQRDRLVGGEIGYADNAISFSRAALYAQNYIYENKLPIVSGGLFSHETVVALNQDKNGVYYWAFAVPSKKMDTFYSYYVIRVDFNEDVTMRQIAETPKPEDL